MKLRYPDYYRRFSCIASECEDTCCKGWGISIDRNTLKRYRQLGRHKILGSQMKKGIDYRNRRFRLEKGYCAFLNEDKLCSICLEMGEEMMCRTCRRYPRHMEVYGTVREASLSLSCPEAARLILNRQDETVYLEKVFHGEEEQEKEEKEKNPEYLETLLSLRDSMFRLLRNQKIPIKVRLSMILALAHDGGRRLKEGGFSRAAELAERYEAPETAAWFSRRLETFGSRDFQRRILIGEYLDMTMQMDELSEGWKQMAARCRQVSSVDFPDYQLVNLMEYYLYVYYLGAFYDGDGYTKARFAVLSLLMTVQLASWFVKEKRLEPEKALVQAAYRYSRQTEHSDGNLELAEQFIKRSRSCRLEQMLTCVMADN